jgi:hypothetical protein
METKQGSSDSIMDKESFRKALLLYRGGFRRDLEGRLISSHQKLPNWVEYDISPSELPWKVLEQAILAKDVPKIEQLFGTWEYDTSLLHPAKRSVNLDRLLSAAVSTGDRAIVKLLLSNGAKRLSQSGLPHGEPLTTTGGTFEEILDDLVKAGWEFRGTNLLR